MKGNVNDPKRISPYDLNGIAKLSSKPVSLTDSLLRSRRDPEELLKRISALEAEVEELKPYRDGYDLKEKMPNMGVEVWILVETSDSRQVWEACLSNEFGSAKFYSTKYLKNWNQNAITRWWPLPEVHND